MSAIKHVVAREILDSRGNPTLEVDIMLEDGSLGRASVPSGASCGKNEAIELRDEDKSRYGGKGVVGRARIIEEEIAEQLKGLSVLDQFEFDNYLIELDGTKNKSALGANTTLAISLAVAKAASAFYGMALFRYLGGQIGRSMPLPMMNVINGGAHANNSLDIQEFMIIPDLPGGEIGENIRAGAEIYQALKSYLKEKGYSVAVGDEGGFAPSFTDTRQALDALIIAIQQAGYTAGEEIKLALDVAASEFYTEGYYHFQGEKLSSAGMVAYFDNLVNSYPIFSIEDGMAEDDFVGWQELTSRLGERVMLIGDDLFVTNIELLAKGIELSIANAILIKPNQIGTVSESLAAIRLAGHAGYETIMSHRSGETEDVSIAHLAIAAGCGMLKTGAPCRSERVAKYNELIRISEMLY